MALLLGLLAGCNAPAPKAKAPPAKYLVSGLKCKPHLKEYDAGLREPAWDLIRKYSPEGVFIIREHRKITRKLCGRLSQHFASFISPARRGASYNISLTISVHEMAHSFSSWMPAMTARSLSSRNDHVWITHNSTYGSVPVFLPLKGVVHVPRTRSFPARKIAARVPEALRNFMFRGTIQDSRHASNATGIYGLLNEFHASFHAHQMTERMMRAAELQFFEPTDFLKFLYFKYYILEYLDYARHHEDRIFQGIMRNRVFVKTFVDLHDRFEKLHLAHLEFRRRNVTTRPDGSLKFRNTTYRAPDVAKNHAVLTKTLAQPRLQRMMSRLRRAAR